MASANVQELDEMSFDEVVLQGSSRVLVDFTAAWCAPCKVLSRLLDQVAPELGNVLVVKVDVDACPSLVGRFGVRGMPTLVLFDGGTEVARRLGSTNEQGLRELVSNGRRTSAA